MRGRKRQRKKWIKRNFIEVVPGMFIPRNPAVRVHSAFMSIGAYRAVAEYLGDLDPFPKYMEGMPNWGDIAVDCGNGRTEYTFTVKGSK